MSTYNLTSLTQVLFVYCKFKIVLLSTKKGEKRAAALCYYLFVYHIPFFI